MFNFVRKSSLFVRHWRHTTLTLRASPIHEFQQCLPLSTTANTKQQSLTVSYLINTCGFSPESALLVSKRFQLNDPDKADTVISFFKSHDFSEEQISSIIKKHPNVLLYDDPEKTLLPKLSFYFFRCLSTPTDLYLARLATENPTVLYLVNTCGFSLEPAQLVCYHLHQEHMSPDKAEAVISIFRNHGFEQTQIRNLIQKLPKVLLHDPDKVEAFISFFINHGFSQTHISNFIKKILNVLLYDPEKTILPKLEFFYSKGFSSSDFAIALCKDHFFLDASLEKDIIPNFNYISELLESQERTIAFIKHRPNFLRGDIETRMKNVPTRNILLEHGVPKSNISHCWYSLLSIENMNLFKEVVEEVKEMGINPSKIQFVIAVNLKFEMSGSEWEDQVDIYKRWGWSEEEFLEAFRKYPQIMRASEDKIMALMDFFVNKMGLEPSDIAKHPNIVGRNLIQRIVPRAVVFHFLLKKGLIKSKHDGLDTLFLEKFVNPYDEAPQLLKLYQHKLIQARFTHDYNSIGKLFDSRLDFSWFNFN